MSVKTNKKILRDHHGYHNIVDCLIMEAFEMRERVGNILKKVNDMDNRLRHFEYMNKRG